MNEYKLFADPFFGEREKLIKGCLGSQLDQTSEIIKQLYSPCTSRLFNAEMQLGPSINLTVEGLIDLEPKKCQALLSAYLYDHALWYLEASCIMLRSGIIGCVYTNLRTCLETIIVSHIIENYETELNKFLTGKEINLSVIEGLLTPKYNEDIKQIKYTLGQWGIHTNINSTIIGIFCDPLTLDKMISETNNPKSQILHEQFVDYGKVCLQAINTVFLVFMFIVSKRLNLKKS
jgi:hypothetical protein